MAFSSCVASCCRQAAVEIPLDHDRLRTIGTLYGYAIRDLGRAPRNQEELLEMFHRLGIPQPGSYLISSRDSESFVILWGMDIHGKYLGTPSPLAYERTGKDGNRLVINCRQEVAEVGPEEFRSLKFPEGHQPES